MRHTHATTVMVNKQNPNKYIEVRRYACGHYRFKQSMRWAIFKDGVWGSIVNYNGCSLKRAGKGIWHRCRKAYLDEFIFPEYKIVGIIEGR